MNKPLARFKAETKEISMMICWLKEAELLSGLKPVYTQAWTASVCASPMTAPFAEALSSCAVGLQTLKKNHFLIGLRSATCAQRHKEEEENKWRNPYKCLNKRKREHWSTELDSGMPQCEQMDIHPMHGEQNSTNSIPCDNDHTMRKRARETEECHSFDSDINTEPMTISCTGEPRCNTLLCWLLARRDNNLFLVPKACPSVIPVSSTVCMRVIRLEHYCEVHLWLVQSDAFSPSFLFCPSCPCLSPLPPEIQTAKH